VLQQLHACLRSQGVLFSSNPRGNGQEGWNGERYGAFHDWPTWRDLMTAAGFDELDHFYRPPGLPFEQQLAGERMAQALNPGAMAWPSPSDAWKTPLMRRRHGRTVSPGIILMVCIALGGCASAPLPSQVTNVLGMQMVLLTAGEFTMGNEASARKMAELYPEYEPKRLLSLEDETPA
jgi:hypothetical protein